MTRHRPHRVVVLLLEPLIGYDAVIPAQLLGEAVDDAGRHLYDVTMASLDGGPVRTPSGYAVVPQHDVERPAHGGHGDRARHPDQGPAARRHHPRRRARRPPVRAPRHPDGLDLHRGVRARRGRAARRPARDDPLGVRRPAHRALPAGPDGRRRAVHRRRRRAHQRRPERRRRPLPAPDPARPRLRGRQPGRAALCRTAVARWRPGAVHRAARARACPTSRPHPRGTGPSSTSTPTCRRWHDGPG